MKLNRKNPLVFRRSGDQSRSRGSVGSRPASRRRRVVGNNCLFTGETRTVPVSHCIPPCNFYLTDKMTDSSKKKDKV